MTWWCSATGRPWTWAWQWYPGVHLLLILVAVAWWFAGRRAGWARRPWGWFVAGWVILLATLDWPIGKLGAGYLASAHTLQFLLLTEGAAPLLLRAIPPDGWAAIARRGAALMRTAAHPLVGILGYNLLVVFTHFPTVVDNAMKSQAGSMAIDLSWLVAGALLWWPILAPREFNRVGVFGTILYIFGATAIPTVPAMMMVFSNWPIYSLYELAPRVWPHFTANDDLKLAGLSMKIIGEIPLWATAFAVFLRGASAEGELVNA
jgi:cytochrome c oxidase assembly factor CtaG